MGKFAVLFLILTSALGLSACGNANPSDTFTTGYNHARTGTKRDTSILPRK